MPSVLLILKVGMAAGLKDSRLNLLSKEVPDFSFAVGVTGPEAGCKEKRLSVAESGLANALACSMVSSLASMGAEIVGSGDTERPYDPALMIEARLFVTGLCVELASIGSICAKANKSMPFFVNLAIFSSVTA